MLSTLYLSILKFISEVFVYFFLPQNLLVNILKGKIKKCIYVRKVFEIIKITNKTEKVKDPL